MLRLLLLGLLPACAALAEPTVSGYGNYDCTIVNADGSLSPTEARPADLGLATCVRDQFNHGYFCGTAGAVCRLDGSTDKCDGGYCQQAREETGICSGGYGALPEAGYGCLGSLKPDPASGRCGVGGSPCGTLIERGGQLVEEAYNPNCLSGLCDSTTLTCVDSPVAADPPIDPVYPRPAVPPSDSAPALTYQKAAPPLARRARNRPVLPSLCPSGLTLCQLGGGAGYECIDTDLNLEQCGACASDGGVDCTTLPGVAAVGCIKGYCRVWACEPGWGYVGGRCKKLR
ncbi:hypothetical protein JCM10908_002425, partial [Rhodotorula pacifica]|uniref:uncharacterized protein n=1 Tax=Rhodotorula pacifica TaxID=1495444 RepID=UPI003178E0B1